MRCVNCQNEVNPGGMVCPYCHGHPAIFGSGPYYPEIQPGPGDCAVTAGILGVICLPVFPVVGVALLGGALIRGLWLKMRG
jgi:hypothetical protein